MIDLSQLEYMYKVIENVSENVIDKVFESVIEILVGRSLSSKRRSKPSRKINERVLKDNLSFSLPETKDTAVTNCVIRNRPIVLVWEPVQTIA